MRITTFTDFGLRTLVYLAAIPTGTLSSVQEVAKNYNISQNHLVKVAGKLRKLGYINALRGQNGGICLAKAPHEINIGDVIAQLENHLDGVDCSSPACHLSPDCKLRDALKGGIDAFIGHMRQYTLADVTGDNSDLQPLLLQESPPRKTSQAAELSL